MIWIKIRNAKSLCVYIYFSVKALALRNLLQHLVAVKPSRSWEGHSVASTVILIDLDGDVLHVNLLLKHQLGILKMFQVVLCQR